MASHDNSAKANNDYVNELIKERKNLSPQYTYAHKLLQQELDRLNNSESGDDSQRKDSHITVHSGKQVRLKIKVHIPVDENPNFNFVGKLLGPKGSSLQQLQEVTQTRMAICGRGSMRDKKKEEELRNQGDPKYLHLHEELHVEVSAYAPAAEAYRRMSVACAELHCFFVPTISSPFFPYPPIQSDAVQSPDKDVLLTTKDMRGPRQITCMDQPTCLDYYEDMRGPPLDGKPIPLPYAAGGPPRRGLLSPPTPMGLPMIQGREPLIRSGMVPSAYTTPDIEEWDARSVYNSAAPAARAARTRDYVTYEEYYAECNMRNAASYYDFTAEPEPDDDGYGSELLHKMMDDMKEALKGSLDENVNFKIKLNIIKGQLRSCLQQKGEADLKLEKLEKEFQATLAKNSNLIQELNELQSELKASEKQGKTFLKKYLGVKEVLDVIVPLNSSYEQQLAKLKEELKCSLEYGDKQAVKSLTSQIELLEKQCCGYKEEKGELINNLQELENKIDVLKESLDSKSTECKSLRKEARKLEEDNASYLSELQKSQHLNEKLDEMKEALLASIDENGNIKMELNKIKGQLQSCLEQKGEADLKLEKLKEELQASLAKNSNLKTELNELKNALKASEVQGKTFSKKFLEVKEVLDVLLPINSAYEQEYAKLKEELKLSHDHGEQLTKTAESLKARVELLEKQSLEYNSDKEQLLNQLKELQDKIDVSKEHFDKLVNCLGKMDSLASEIYFKYSEEIKVLKRQVKEKEVSIMQLEKGIKDCLKIKKENDAKLENQEEDSKATRGTRRRKSDDNDLEPVKRSSRRKLSQS